MSKIAELIVRLTGDTRGLRGPLQGAQRDVQGFTVSLRGVAGAMGAAFGAAGIVAATKNIIAARVTMDGLERGLIAVTGSATAATARLVTLREVAKLPGLGLEEAVRGDINLQAIGFSAARSESILRTFGNALATVGRGREDLNEVIRQLGQLASRGKVTADNLKPIIERVPQVAAIIKKEFGTIDTEALQKLGISSEQLISVLLRELGKLPPVSTGIANNIENLGDSWNRTLDAMGRVIEPVANKVVTAAANMAEGFADFVDTLNKGETTYQRFIQRVGGDINIASAAMLVLKTATNQAASALGELNASPGAMFFGVAGQGIRNFVDEGRLVSPVLGAVTQSMRDMQPPLVASVKNTSALTKEKSKLKTMTQLLREELESRHNAALKNAAQLYLDATRRTGEFAKTVELATETIKDNSAALVQLPVDANRAIGELNRLREQLDLVYAPRYIGGAVDVPLPSAPRSGQASKDAQAAYEAAARAARRSGRQQSEAMQQVSLVVNDTARNIAKLIFEGGKFKDVMKNAASEIAQAFTRVLIQRAIKPLLDGLDAAISKSKILSTIFGPGGGGGASAPGVPSGGGPGGGAAGAASGAAGWIGAVGSIGTMVSSIIGNFQMAGMNKSLDLIVKHTLQTANQLIYGLQPQVNQYLPALSGIHDRLMEIRTLGVGIYAQPGYAAIGGGGVTVNITGFYGGPAGLDALTAEISRRLKRQGA